MKTTPEHYGLPDRAFDRLTRLQALTAALSEAATSHQVASAVVTHGLTALDARMGLLAVLDETGDRFVSLHIAGVPQSVIDAWHTFPADAPVPLADAVRENRPVILPTRQERLARYPTVPGPEGQRVGGAVVALPLRHGGVVGGLGFAFPGDRAFTAEDHSFLLTVAGLCEQALDRARLLDAERAAREKAEQDCALLTAIVQSSEDAIVSKTLDGIITTWNPAAERLYGWSAEEVLGRAVSLLFPPGGGDELRTIMARLRRGERISQHEAVRRRKDGTLVDVSLSISPIKDSRGNITGFSGIGRDVTEQKRLEDELRRHAGELAEADRRKDEFLAMLAHELRNPLAPIRNALQVLRLLRPGESRFQTARDIIDRQVRHLARLVDDLLDVSRLTRGKVELRKEVVDLASVVSRAVETSRPVIEGRRHTLTVSPPAAPMRLSGDAVRLTQVISNLLNNSAKYTDEGGHIWLSAAAEGDEAVVRVKDTGIGIPAELSPHIFDLFVQAERGPDRSQGGLGIGLTLVKSLVELHGGTVTAHSEGPGQGSEFVVRLPVVAGPQRQRAPDDAPQEASGPSPARRVLVVDDNADAANSLAMFLRLKGHEVCAAYDGAGVLDAARAFRPDVVLLDIGLPGGLTGYDLAPRIREVPGLTNVVLVALTGYGRAEDKRRAEQAGFDAHLTKPADLDELQALLGGSRGERYPGSVPGADRDASRGPQAG